VTPSVKKTSQIPSVQDKKYKTIEEHIQEIVFLQSKKAVCSHAPPVVVEDLVLVLQKRADGEYIVYGPDAKITKVSISQIRRIKDSDIFNNSPGV
jgi:hypothetical protein